MRNEDSCIVKLLCTNCKTEFDYREKHTSCKSCGKVLFPIYDYEKAKETLSKQSIQTRNVYNIWRLNEIMPVTESRFRFSLGEGWTPIIRLKNSGIHLGLKNLYLKDEGQNPTGTFKSRGLCAAVSRGVELGIQDFSIPTAGNAGAALSAYAAYTGTKAHVFMPEDTTNFLQSTVISLGGDLRLVAGLITDAADKCKLATKTNKWFDVSTLKEPYRVEGKKTMAFEVVEQFNWTVPDVLVYPTGGGTGIVGMWKAFDELESVGLIGPDRPRLVTVQSSGCAPIVKAFQDGKRIVEFWEDAQTFALGLRVPAAIGDYLILKALNESNGTAVEVKDSEILVAMKKLAKIEGIMQSPEGAATFAGIEKLLDINFISSSDSIVLFGTGSGFIYPEFWKKTIH
ncbi:MAG: threonine synthase [Promethearchaeota archaeon]